MSTKSGKRGAATSERIAEIRRGLPPIDECLRAAEAIPALSGLSRSYLKLQVQRAQAALRAAIIAGRETIAGDRAAMVQAVLREAERAIAADEPRLHPVVNATGVVLHTNLGRALLAESAVEAVEAAARSSVNLEYDLETGGRGDRDSIVEDEICALTGAEAATVVNNNAAAVVLALNSLAEGREVVVSRGEMIEIGGSFRLPDVMAKSGALLKEVGTTNRTHRSDYADAIGPATALLLKVHVTFSGDKLLGGPQAGIIVGRRDAIERIKRNPLKRALRCDKLTLAALSATLRLYLRSGDIGAELPTLRTLKRSKSEIAAMAPRAREILIEQLGAEYRVEIVDATSQVGSGALPVKELDTIALRVTHPDKSANAIASMFRRARIIGRIADDSFQLDLRTVEDPALFAVKLTSD